MTFAPQPAPAPLTQATYDDYVQQLKTTSAAYVAVLTLLQKEGADARSIANAKTDHERADLWAKGPALERLHSAIVATPPAEST
jgi:hypothetical protein